MLNRRVRLALRLSGVLLPAVWIGTVRAGADDAPAPAAAPPPAPAARPRLTVQLGHAKPVFAAALSPDGAFVLTGSEDATARLWETASGRVVRRFDGHAAGVTSVAFSPDGTQILTASPGSSTRRPGPKSSASKGTTQGSGRWRSLPTARAC
jgi:WD40 repeat protein